jgi:tetratricopeptide (TPR) repeat protein
LFFLCISAGSLRAADPAAAFDQANRLYEEGKFRDAAAAYGGLISSGASSAPLYFNLGNAQFKAGHIGEAIVAFRKAGQLAPRDPDIRANLQFARRQVTGPTLKSGWIERNTGTLTVNEWTLLAVVPVWAWLLLLIAGQMKPAWKPSLRSTTTICAAVSLLACAALAWVLQHRMTDHTVVVVARNTVARFGPFEESPNAFVADDGAELALSDSKDGWFQVTDGGKSTGWVRTNAVSSLH